MCRLINYPWYVKIVCWHRDDNDPKMGAKLHISLYVSLIEVHV